MKFKSRKDWFFKMIIWSFVLLFLITSGVQLYFSGTYKLEFLITDLPLLAVSGFLLYLYFGTSYELTTLELKYKSGPIHGRILISDIREIIIGQTLWTGLRPATARHGLIIKYQKYEEIYITPLTNEKFIDAILKLKPEIKIVEAVD